MSTSLRRPGALLLVPALAAALALSACGGGSTTAGAGDADTFRFALASDPGCLNPRVAGNNDAAYPSRQLVDSLTDQDPETGKIEPWLAETFWDKLRRDHVHLHPADGRDLQRRHAADRAVVQGRTSTRSSRTAPRWRPSPQFLTGYTGTVVVDELTVRVELRPAQRPVPAGHLQPLPGHRWPRRRSRRARRRAATGRGRLRPLRTRPLHARTRGHADQAAGLRLGFLAVGPDRRGHLAKARLQGDPRGGRRARARCSSGQVDAINSVPPPGRGRRSRPAGSPCSAGPTPAWCSPWPRTSSARPLTDVRVRQAAQPRRRPARSRRHRAQPETPGRLQQPSPHHARLGRPQPPADPRPRPRPKRLLDAAGWTTGSRRHPDEGRQEAAPGDLLGARLQPQPDRPGADPAAGPAGGHRAGPQPAAGRRAAGQAATGDFDLSWGNSTRADPDILRNTYWRDGAAPYRDRRPGPGEDPEGAADDDGPGARPVRRRRPRPAVHRRQGLRRPGLRADDGAGAAARRHRRPVRLLLPAAARRGRRHGAAER